MINTMNNTVDPRLTNAPYNEHFCYKKKVRLTNEFSHKDKKKKEKALIACKIFFSL